jgi:hypothetical protein
MNVLTNTVLQPSSVREPALIEITSKMLPFLEKVLQQNKKTDPFSRSAGYYAMTGRKGLWLYGDNHTSMVIARHPNKEDTILFFPPFGKDPFSLIQTALNDPQIPEGEIQIARVGQDDLALAFKLQAAGAPAPQAETILDWTYPIHVISAEKVIEHRGGEYNNFRSHLNKAFRAGYSAQPLNANAHYDDALEIVTRWAKDGKKDGYTFDDLTTPTKQLLNLMKDNALSLSGVIVFDGVKPVGFWIWDEGDTKHKTAMSLARVSTGDRGAAEFAGLKMAEFLKERGFVQICLGGSETESLDKFKRKFGPVQSIELKTINCPAIK